MTKKIALILTMMAAVLVMSTGVASASNLNCNANTTLKLHYKAGLNAGKSIVKQAWNSPTVDHDPNNFDAFKDAVHLAVDAGVHAIFHPDPNDPTPPSKEVKCRAKGFAQGVCDQLGAIQTEVGNVCLLDGNVWGEFSAQLYCALSIAFEGLAVDGLLPNPPDGLCGSQFELGCDQTFVSTAAATAECPQYTTGGFVAVYTESRANMCVYEIP